MSKKNDLFCSYVAIVGGREAAARELGKSISLIGHLMNGIRGITPEIAMAVHERTGGQIDKARLRPDLWQVESRAA